MIVRIAFYRYNKKLINFGISAWTWPFNMFTPGYSHVEIGFKLPAGWEYFSSTNRGKAKGTRWIRPHKLFEHRERWDVYEIEVDSISEMLKRARQCEGVKYDWFGIFGFITPLGLINSKKKWYCSEVCYTILAGFWRKRISPRRFYSYIKKSFNPVLIKVSYAQK